MFIVSISQEGHVCFTKSDGLKRGFQSMDSSDYQMVEIASGKPLILVIIWTSLEEWCYWPCFCWAEFIRGLFWNFAFCRWKSQRNWWSHKRMGASTSAKHFGYGVEWLKQTFGAKRGFCTFTYGSYIISLDFILKKTTYSSRLQVICMYVYIDYMMICIIFS